MTLREMVSGVSDEDLRVLVAVACAATGDVATCREIAHEVGKTTVQLRAFGERVLKPLAAQAEKENSGLAFSIHVDKVWVEDRGVADKGCVAFHLNRDVERTVLERAIGKAAGDDAQLEFYDSNSLKGQCSRSIGKANIKRAIVNER